MSRHIQPIETHTGRARRASSTESDPMSNNPCLTATLEYAARGWHVLPCHVARDGRCSCGKTEEQHGAGQ